jgi:hypothetical protein
MLAPLTSRIVTGAPPAATRRDALARPGVDAQLRRKRIRQVGLERDPRVDTLEARPRQRLDEGIHRDLEVPILLHVQVDELGNLAAVRPGEARSRGGPVEQLHAIAENLDRVTPGDRSELRVERRDLDGDHLDRRELQRREVRLQATPRFVLSEQRLAEEIHVHANPVCATLLEVPGQVLLLGRQDHVGGLPAQLALHQRHGHAREVAAKGLEALEHGAVHRAEEARHALDIEDVGELLCAAPRASGPEGLVRHLGQRGAIFEALEHPLELRLLAFFLPGLQHRGARLQVPRQRDRALQCIPLEGGEKLPERDRRIDSGHRVADRISDLGPVKCLRVLFRRCAR